MATQDTTLGYDGERHFNTTGLIPSDGHALVHRGETIYPSPRDLRDPVTGQYPPLAGADGEPDPGIADPAPKGDKPEPTLREQRRNSPPGEDATIEEWKQYARAWQDRAQGDKTAVELKRERKAREAAEKALQERTDADKSEQEKALDQARKEAADTARQEITGQVRGKLLKAEIKALAAGKFADPDDAHKLLDLEDDDIFTDDGDIQTDALQSALDELLERKPHLKAGPPNGGKPSGDADAGKGTRAQDLESIGVAGHLKRIQQND